MAPQVALASQVAPAPQVASAPRGRRGTPVACATLSRFECTPKACVSSRWGGMGNEWDAPLGGPLITRGESSTSVTRVSCVPAYRDSANPCHPVANPCHTVASQGLHHTQASAGERPSHSCASPDMPGMIGGFSERDNIASPRVSVVLSAPRCQPCILVCFSRIANRT